LIFSYSLDIDISRGQFFLGISIFLGLNSMPKTHHPAR
jgi:hypothetical protein